MNTLIDALKTHIENKYHAHTIILYGSFARGEQTEESDLDVICFVEEKEPMNDTEQFNDFPLDLWVYPENEMSKPENYLHVHDGVVLLDKKSKAQKFLSDVKNVYNHGPEPTSKAQKKFLGDWMHKMYKRTLKDDIEGHFRHVWLLRDVLEIYFEMCDMQYEGPKKALNFLKSNDKSVYALYERALLEKPGHESVLELITAITNKFR